MKLWGKGEGTKLFNKFEEKSAYLKNLILVCLYWYAWYALRLSQSMCNDRETNNSLGDFTMIPGNWRNFIWDVLITIWLGNSFGYRHHCCQGDLAPGQLILVSYWPVRTASLYCNTALV